MSGVGDVNTGAFGPTPPGVDLSATRVPTMYGSIVTISVLATLFVALRFYCRISCQNPIWWDDYLIIAGLLLTWGTAACIFESIPYGMGRHIYVLEQHRSARLWKNFFADVIIYAIGVSCTKLSIVMFYKRIFASNLLAWPLVVLVVLYPVIAIIVMLTGCKPMSYIWEQYSDPNAVGECVNLQKFYFGNGIWAASIDLVLLLAPIPLTWKLQMKTQQKFAVLGVFALGSFVVVASVVRIIMLRRFMAADDPVWTIGPIYMWSSIEPFVGIICACLPTLSPMFKRMWQKKKTSTGDSNSRRFLSINTLSGNGQKRSAPRLRPDDELMLTTNTNIGQGAERDGDSDGDVHQLSHLHIQKDVDVNVEWESRGRSAGGTSTLQTVSENSRP